YQNVAEMVAINGEFVPINPGEFRNQFNVKINVGLGTGSKEQQANRILGLIPLIQAGAQAGVVRPQHVAEVIKLYVQALEFKNPEKFVDPEPSGMPPNPEAFQQMQQQVQQQMGQMQEQLQQAAQENEGLKAEKRAKEGDLVLKAAQIRQKGVEIEMRGQEAAANIALKAGQATDGQLAERVATIEDVLGQILSALQPQGAA